MEIWGSPGRLGKQELTRSTQELILAVSSHQKMCTPDELSCLTEVPRGIYGDYLTVFFVMERNDFKTVLMSINRK